MDDGKMTKAEYFAMLVKRDTPMAMKRCTSEIIGSYDVCPVCDAYVLTNAAFCGECGQRFDRENYQF